MAQSLMGKISIPSTIWPLIARADGHPGRHQKSDAYVIELCSAKTILLDEWPVQLNYLAARFPGLFEHRSAARAYWNAIDANDKNAIQEILDSRPLENDDKAMLSSIRREWATEASLLKDMAYLRTTLPGVLFVTHINAKRADGSPLITRQKYIELVERAAAKLGVSIYNPTEVMQFVGQSNAIADNSDGLAHYQPQFEDLIGHDVLAAIGAYSADVNAAGAPQDPLFRAAVLRHSAPQAALKALATVEAKKKAMALWQLKQFGADIADTELSRIASHLPPLEEHLLWATYTIGNPQTTDQLRDTDVAQVINALPATNAHDKVRGLLAAWNGPISSVISQALDKWIGAQIHDGLSLAKACSAVLRYCPKHAKANKRRAALKSKMLAEVKTAKTEEALDDITTLNSALDEPIPAVDLSLSRAYVALQSDDKAIEIGLRAFSQAPLNVTLSVMLMRAAQRRDDPRLPMLAKLVMQLAGDRPKYLAEAERILTAPSKAVA